jgi:succinate-acetate transporter protein
VTADYLALFVAVWKVYELALWMASLKLACNSFPMYMLTLDRCTKTDHMCYMMKLV